MTYLAQYVSQYDEEFLALGETKKDALTKLRYMWMDNIPRKEVKFFKVLPVKSEVLKQT